MPLLLASLHNPVSCGLAGCWLGYLGRVSVKLELNNSMQSSSLARRPQASHQVTPSYAHDRWVDVNWQASEIAASLPAPATLATATAPAAPASDIQCQFDTATAAGFTTIRIFAHGESSSFELQTAPGVYAAGMYASYHHTRTAAALQLVMQHSQSHY